METLIIVLIFVGIPLALFAFIIFAAVVRAHANAKLIAALEDRDEYHP